MSRTPLRVFVVQWKKLGLVYKAGNIHPKLLGYAANPLPVWIGQDTYRVFFSGRDEQNRSSVGWVDIDIVQQRVLQVCDTPAFLHGQPGSFYSHGVSIGNCYEANGNRYMLFMGWQCPEGGHWRGEIGRLLVGDDLGLTLDGDKPFLALDETDPVSLSYPWVIHEPSGLYRMWYGSTRTWHAANGEMVHVLNYAESRDGQHWQRKGLGVPYEENVAQAFSRPTVVGNALDGYRMWFSYRSGTGQTYRIGYADSTDGTQWALRLGQAGIDVSAAGWDASMIEYPFVLEHKGRLYLFYNGNDYGKTGFGLAVAEPG